jgi:putative FmdB family regulatory protein
MPTYVYECRSCAKVFEAEQKMTEPPLSDCGCGAAGSLRRLIQPAGVLFKGQGFHVNDYAPSEGPPKAGPAPCGADCACEADKAGE